MSSSRATSMGPGSASSSTTTSLRTNETHLSGNFRRGLTASTARSWITNAYANTDFDAPAFCASADVPAAVPAPRHHETDGERSGDRVERLVAEASLSDASPPLRLCGNLLHRRRSHHRLRARHANAATFRGVG